MNEAEIIFRMKQGESTRSIARSTDIDRNVLNEVRRKAGITPHAATPLLPLDVDFEYECSRCRKIKPFTDFQHGRRGTNKEYRYSFCNACRNDAHRIRKSDDVESYLRAATGRLVRRARESGIPVDIDNTFVIDQYHAQHGLCFYTDQPMTHELGKGAVRTNISIDKVIPDLGYVKGNVVLCQLRINTMKSDATLDEMKLWMPDWYERSMALFEE